MTHKRYAEEITANPQSLPNEDDRLVLDTAMEAGHILLENGAEISRVEETMSRICSHYGVEDSSFFVLSNGIFTTGGNSSKEGLGHYAHVQHIPVKGTQMNKIIAVNQLSREIAEGKYTIQEVRDQLARIRELPGKSPLAQILASAVGSGCFCILFGGTLMDALAALFAGALLYVFVLYVSSRFLSKITGTVLSSALVAVLCILFHSFGLGDSFNHMIIGSVIPLIPGVPFTNGIRDLADGDYISGAVRLLDATLGFLCIALGVGIVILCYTRLGGAAI